MPSISILGESSVCSGSLRLLSDKVGILILLLGYLTRLEVAVDMDLRVGRLLVEMCFRSEGVVGGFNYIVATFGDLGNALFFKTGVIQDDSGDFE